MKPLNQVDIEEKTTIYDVSMCYHSDLKCENFDVAIECAQEPNGRITIKPGKTFFGEDGFQFIGSDPDRVVALANMMLAFAQMAKNEKQKPIDKNDDV